MRLWRRKWLITLPFGRSFLKNGEICDLEAIKSHLQAFVDWHKALHQNDDENDLSVYTDTPINNVFRWCKKYLDELNRYDKTQEQKEENTDPIAEILHPESKFMEFCKQSTINGKMFDNSKKTRLLYDILGGLPNGETVSSIHERVKSAGLNIGYSTFSNAFQSPKYDLSLRLSKLREEIKRCTTGNNNRQA